MSKKRVHELAKTLKEQHGIEFSNAELVEKLHQLGYAEVKSHSSSLEDDQATAALEKILAERKPKPAAPKPTGPGFVVRKRAAQPDVHAAPAPAPGQPAHAQAEAVHAQQAHEAVSAPEAQEQPQAGEEQQQPAAATGDGQQPAAEAAQPEAPQPAAGGAPGEAPMPMAAAAGPQPARQAEPPRRPTSTQAVVISRPAVPVRRVTPPSGAHQQIPLAPGPRALGEVREFKVVPGMLGREREFIDVSKDKRGRGRSVRDAEAQKALSGKELMQSVLQDRAYVPVRGKKKKPTKKGQKTQITQMAEHKKVIRIEETISLSDLSQAMGVKASDLIRKLMQAGTMATMNQMLDADTATFLANDFGFTVEKKGFEVEEFIPEVADTPEALKLRPPVVTVMGHVDHGKTSLLDAIRQTEVAAGEAGGITQHIGAYSVATPHGPITFLDTPGHEAFTAMRQRGANVTDIVILVVAADDGVMPTTVEAIKQAKAAGVTIVVAINKIDKQGAAPERVMQQLTEHGLVAEKWGGDVIMAPVSARTKEGLDDLLEQVSLQAEVLELKSNPDKVASGAVIEAKLEKGRGPVATVLVQEGTLRTGDPIVTGTHYGKVRAMMNDKGELTKEVGPGYPVEVLGLDGVPTAGDEFNVVESEKAAKEIAEHRALKARQKELGGQKKASLEDLFAKVKEEGKKELNIVVKADVQGSAEAVSQALAKCATKKVGVKILTAAVGAITESDVLTAAAGKALIVGFNSKPETKVEQIATQQDVKIKLYNIIYEAVDDVKLEMAALLDPIIKEKPLGKAEVLQIFNVPKQGAIAGSAVRDGVVKRTGHVRVLREGKVLHQGKIASLRRMKDDVKEVASGFECGIGIEGFNDVKAGDTLEVFELEAIPQSLE